jgi:hypothetical protein
MVNLKGKWWIPGQSKKSVYGSLSIGKKIILSIEGNLTEKLASNQNIEVILGNTNEGAITLLNNYIVRSSYSYLGKHQKYCCLESLYGIKNCRIKQINTPLTKSFNLSYPILFNWLSQFDSEIKESDKSIKINNISPRKISIPIDNDLSIEFNTFIATYGNLSHPIKYIVKESAFIKVIFNEKKSFFDILQAKVKIDNFLKLTVGQQIKDDLFSLDVSPSNKKTAYQTMEIVRNGPTSTEKRNIVGPMMLIYYPKVKQFLPTMLSKWFLNYEYFESVYSLYFNAYYSDSLTIEQSFLYAVQSLEALHRRIKSNFILPAEDYKKMVCEIVDSVPEYHQNWLSGKLVFANEPTLKQRVDELLSDFEYISQVLVDDKDFSQEVVRARNLYTHYDPKKVKNQVDYRKMLTLTHKIRLILEATFMKELGLPLELITTIFEDKYLSSVRYLQAI